MNNQSEKEFENAIVFIQLLPSPLHVDFSQTNHFDDFKQNAVIYELDNYSDGVAFHYARQLVQQSDRIIVIVQALESQERGKVTDFINRLIKLRAKTHCLLIGEHPLLQKLLKKVGQAGFLQSNDPNTLHTWLHSIM